MKRLVTYLLLSLFVITTNVEVAEAVSFPVHREISAIGKKKKKEKKKGKVFFFVKKIATKVIKAASGIETFSLLSFIFGLLGLIFVWVIGILGLLFGLLGLIFGFIGIGKASDSTSKTFAIIGIIAGGLVVLLFLISLIFLAALVASV